MRVGGKVSFDRVTWNDYILCDWWVLRSVYTYILVLFLYFVVFLLCFD
jgi:hypothetical protein